MKTYDIGMSLSPFMAPYIAQLREMEFAEQRRKIREEIAQSMGVPADLLFNPLVQRLLAGPIVPPGRFIVSLDRYVSKRRPARRAHHKRIKRR